MYLEVVTPEKKIFTGNVRLIQLPGTKGSFAILRNHAPMISTLEEGTIRIVSTDGEQTYIEIAGGVIENSKNNIIVLVESV